MKSLFTKFYFSVLGLILLFAVGAFGAWHFFGQAEPRAGGNRWIAELAREKLPSNLNAQQLNEQLGRWRQRVRADLILVDTRGQVLGHSGNPFTLPVDFDQWRQGREDGWIKLEESQERRSEHFRDRGWVYGIALENGERWMFMRRISMGAGRGNPVGPFGPNPLRGFAVSLAAIVLILSLASYPLLKRLTRRLVQMEQGVAKFGAGDLGARVDVTGQDELAKVAATFNQAADQVQALVQSQRSLLANASHELRSPLARLKMAVDLSGEQIRPAMREEMDRNVSELDSLIDEILLSSRLDALQAGAGGWQIKREQLDLCLLVRQECEAAGVSMTGSGEPLPVLADARLMRRLTRNLLDNAKRYAPMGQIEVQWLEDKGFAVIRVLDEGPGIPESERQRIFEPFYRVAGASESSGGVGLGLALVRQIANSHEGSIQCLDRPDRRAGSLFEFRMPLVR